MNGAERENPRFPWPDREPLHGALSLARAFFDTLPPSYRRKLIHWVVRAKREETRERRLARLIGDCAAGRRT